MRTTLAASALTWGLLLLGDGARADVVPRNEPACPVGSKRESLGAGHRACVPALCTDLDLCRAPSACVAIPLCIQERPIHSGLMVREAVPAVSDGCPAGSTKEFMRVCAPAKLGILPPLAGRTLAELQTSNCALPLLVAQRTQVLRLLEQCLATLANAQSQIAAGGFALTITGPNAKVGAHQPQLSPVAKCLVKAIDEQPREKSSKSGACTSEFAVTIDEPKAAAPARPASR